MFDESSAVEEFLIDRVREVGWDFQPGPSLIRAASDVMIESAVREALIRLNPEIAAEPSRADEVVYRLRGIILGVTGDGLVRSNEEFMAWVRGERTMPFGPNNEHVDVRLIDFDNLGENSFVVANQVTFAAGPTKRFDIVGFVNGLPLILGEAKTPVRPAVSWTAVPAC